MHGWHPSYLSAIGDDGILEDACDAIVDDVTLAGAVGLLDALLVRDAHIAPDAGVAVNDGVPDHRPIPCADHGNPVNISGEFLSPTVPTQQGANKSYARRSQCASPHCKWHGAAVQATKVQIRCAAGHSWQAGQGLTDADDWLALAAELLTSSVILVAIVAHEQSVLQLTARAHIGVASHNTALQHRALHDRMHACQ